MAMPGSAMLGRTRAVVGWAVAAVVCDLMVALMSYADHHAWAGAPRNSSYAREDDLRYAVTGLGYEVASVLRYVVLAGLVVALLLRSRDVRRGTGRVTSAVRRLRWAAGAMVTVELAYLGVALNGSDPDGTWCVLRIGTCVLSAMVAAAIVVNVRVGNRAARMVRAGPSTARPASP